MVLVFEDRRPFILCCLFLPWPLFFWGEGRPENCGKVQLERPQTSLSILYVSLLHFSASISLSKTKELRAGEMTWYLKMLAS